MPEVSKGKVYINQRKFAYKNCFWLVEDFSLHVHLPFSFTRIPLLLMARSRKSARSTLLPDSKDLQSTTLYFKVLQGTKYCSVQQTTVRLRTTNSYKVLLRTTKYYTILFRTTKLLQSTPKYFSVRHTTVMSYSVEHKTRVLDKVLHNTTPYYKVLHSTTPYYTVLQCTAPYCKALLRATKYD